MRDRDVPPSISVIVISGVRADFIVEAVRSVFASGLAPDQLEVLVTKGYASDSQDEELRQLGASVHFDPCVGIGERLWHALPLTRAPLVAFLDDDDLYEPTRLAHVRQVFDEHPDVGFYRNRVTPIDRDGRPVPRSLCGLMELDPLLDRTGPLSRLSITEPSSFRLLCDSFPWFNTSSMVVRREVLTGPYGHLLETADFSPDIRLYLLALLSGLSLYLDDRRLTRYRTSARPWTELARRAWGGLRSVLESSELSEKYAPAPWPEQFHQLVRNNRRRASWYEFLARIENGRTRPDVVSSLLAYLRVLLDQPSTIRTDPSRLFYLLCVTAYVIKPTLGRTILQRASMTPSISPSRRRADLGELHTTE